MISYNWANKIIVTKIVTSLKERGYRVWIDDEQMRGSILEASMPKFTLWAINSNILQWLMRLNNQQLCWCVIAKNIKILQTVDLKVSIQSAKKSILFLSGCKQAIRQMDGTACYYLFHSLICWRLGVCLGHRLNHEFHDLENWDAKFKNLASGIYPAVSFHIFTPCLEIGERGKEISRPQSQKRLAIANTDSTPKKFSFGSTSNTNETFNINNSNPIVSSINFRNENSPIPAILDSTKTNILYGTAKNNPISTPQVHMICGAIFTYAFITR